MPAHVSQKDAAMTLEDRLTRIEAMLTVLVHGQQTREWYSVEELARLVGRSEFSVRRWCLLGRIAASKKTSGRGAHASWVISHEELERYRRDGLMPAKQH